MQQANLTDIPFNGIIHYHDQKAFIKIKQKTLNYDYVRN